MKKILAAVMAVLMAALLCSCGKTAGAKINLGSSEIYSDAEIKAAAAAVKAKFATFDGCILHSLTYAGDEESTGCLDYVRDANENYSKCIVFKSSFRSPIIGSGAWEKNSEYTWKWYVARTSVGIWEVVDYGYG